MIGEVLFSLPTSMARNISDHFGTRKLGAAFLSNIQIENKNPIYNLLSLGLIIRSKPEG